MTKPTLSENKAHLNLPLPNLEIFKKTEKYDPCKANKLTWAPKAPKFRSRCAKEPKAIEDIFKKHLHILQALPVNQMQ